MMRIAGLIALFAAALAAGLVAFLPARVVFDALAAPRGIAADAVHGRAWDARLYGVRAGAQRAEKVEARLAFWPLFAGRARIDLVAEGEGLILQGRIAVSPGRVAVSELRGGVAAWRLPGLAGLDLPNREMIRVEMDRAAFSTAEGCLEAEGAVRTGLLAAAGARYDADLPVLEGRFACAGPRLALQAATEAEGVDLEGVVRFGRDAFDWRVEAGTEDRRTELLLLGLGFEEAGEVWRAEGRGAYREG